MYTKSKKELEIQLLQPQTRIPLTKPTLDSMKIAIDGRTITAGRSGVGTYAERLVRSLLRLDHKNEYYLFLVEPNEELQAPNLQKILISGYNRLILNRWWENTLLPLFLRNNGIDLYFSPAYALPMLPRFTRALKYLSSFRKTVVDTAKKRVKYLVTVHDVISDILPETFTPKMRLWQSVFNKNAVKVADRILTDSECTKRDFLRIYGGDENKISVLYPSIDERFQRITNRSILNHIRNKYSLPEHFILYLGTIEPRKNITALAKAYSFLPAQLRNKFKLVIGGARGWYSQNIVAEIESLNLKSNIQMLGYVEHEHLPPLYSLASVFVFPSLYEGFGYPPLEAMACGTPVITSNVSSLPEIVQGAGIMVEPHDHHGLSREIQKVLTKKALRDKLRKKGYQRARSFGWKQTAQQAVGIFKDLVGEGR